MYIRRKAIRFVFIVALIVVVMVIGAHFFWPASLSRNEMSRCLAMVEDRNCYAITVNGKELAYFSALKSDTSFSDLSLQRSQSLKTQYFPAFWISSHPMIVSSNGMLLSPASNNDSILTVSERNKSRMLEKTIKVLTKMLLDYSSESSELKYYLDIHGVSDEGFDMISHYAEHVKTKRDSVKHLLSVLNNIKSSSEIKIKSLSSYSVSYIDNKAKTRVRHCKVLSAKCQKGFRVLQITDKKTPKDAVALSTLRFFSPHADSSSTLFSVVYEGLGYGCLNSSQLKVDVVPVRLVSQLSGKSAHDIPSTMLPDGSPVFSDKGNFIGVAYHGYILNTNLFSDFLKGNK